MKLTRDAVFELLQEKVGADADQIDDETLLFSSNLLASFSMVDLMLFIEQRTETKMSPLDVTLDNLDSIARILKFSETQSSAP